MKRDDIKAGDVLSNVDENGCGYYRVLKVCRVKLRVRGESGREFYMWPHLFDGKVSDVAALHADGIRI